MNQDQNSRNVSTESDFSTLFLYNPIPNWVYDIENFKILDVNQSAVKLYGYSKKEFLALTINDLKDNTEISKAARAQEKIYEQEGTIHFGIFRHKKKNGEYILMDIYGHKVSFKGRNALMVSAINVTEREQQLIDLRASEAKLKSAASISNLGYWRLETDGNTLSWSDEVYKIWGRNKDAFSLTFESFLQTIHPEDREEFDREQSRAFSGEKIHDLIHRIIVPDGGIKWVHERGRLVLDTEGNPIAFEGTVQDITAQKEEEQRLKLLESVITNTNDAIMITEAEPFDEPGPKILYVNEAFTKMTGYDAEEVMGQSPRILQGPKSDKQALERLSKAIRNWESCEITTINYKKNGEPFWINFTVSPVADDKGWFTHWVAIERDVTALKNEQIQKELLAKISNVFNEGVDLKTSLYELCKLIVEYADFSLCEIWLPSIHQKTIRLYSKCLGNPVAQDFYAIEGSLTEIPINKGLPGKVWKEKKAIAWGDIDSNSPFLRKKGAKASGIKSVLGIPLKHQEKIVGVLVVGASEDKVSIEQHRPILSKLETFIGSEINRKRLEGDLSHLFEALPDLICLTDFEGRFIKVNKAGCDLLGYTEAELIGTPFQNLVHPADKHTTSNEMLKLKEGQTVFQFENRYITKTGNTIWLSWHSNSLKDEGIVYATAKNITNERKLKELLNDATQLANIGGWEIDLINSKLIWSAEVHKIHDTNPHDYSPDLQSGIDFYREDYRDFVKKTVESSIETGNPFDFEAALISAKGNEKWVRTIGQSEMHNGKCIRLFGSFQDISSLKKTEHRLQSITDDLPGVAFQYYLYPNGKDQLFTVSKASHRIWNLSPQESEENIDLIWEQIKRGGNYEEVRQSIRKSVENLSQWHMQWRNILPNGEVRWHEGFGTPYRLADNTIVFNSMVFDITEEKRITNLYKEVSKMARIGSWEMDRIKQNGNDAMYWSSIVREILEVDDNYNPTLTGGFEFYKEESKSIIQNAVEKLIQDGTEYDEELLIVTPTGKEKWVRCIGKSERIDGVCTKIFGSLQDIHSMKSTSLLIQEIISSISDAFYAVDKNWNFTYFNKEAEKLLDKKSEDVLGKNIWKEFEAAKGTEMEKIYKRVAKSGIAESYEYLYPGNNSWYEINTYPSNGGVSSYFKNIDERKKAAEDLKNAYEEKINIIESIGDAFFTMTNDFVVTYWNNTAEKLLGVKREDLVGKNLWSVFPEAVDLPSYTNYHKVMETREPITFEDFYGIWLEVNAYPSNEGISVFFRDITLRKEADHRLLKAFEEKNKILESIGDAFFAVDNDWIVTYWNKEAENILDRKKEEIVGKNLWEVYADAVDSDFYRRYHKAIATGENVTFEEFYPTLNKWFEVTAYPNAEGLSVYFKDVTLRKQTDIKILEANERFEKISEATNDAIWDWNITEDTLYWGEGFKKLFGYETENFVPTVDYWSSLIHPEDFNAVMNSISESVSNKNTNKWGSEYQLKKANGDYAYVIDKGLIIRDAAGNPIRMIGALTDITYRKRYELELFELNVSLKKHAQELEIANEELDQFAFTASHDLQEPLRMITSFMDLLKRKYGDQLDEKAHQYIYFAIDGAKRMKKIIIDLLEYSRAGRYAEVSESVDLNEVFQEYLRLRRKMIQESKAVINFGNLPIVLAEKTPLIQTIHSLLDNALKYSKPDVAPVIDFLVQENETEWVFEVRDNGIGIDERFFEKIFIIFQRLHNRNQYDGTGIGLAIVKKHVEMWGGKIWVTSVPGQGSSFYFTLNK
ncbi:PAS domain S-box protein [Flavobacterium sedimenticola]|uniref:histidine kinase n=1 Tax=Flavobacterium sedimenticola TaxID=3043286 RepID=A0ABT6XP04_9FLAO|nr:PAS domain S-box protein [Flavobacterium sedimenticola]MDI9256814.1 PAS domain S-box protein [Flavobacterium sedimenticola]